MRLKRKAQLTSEASKLRFKFFLCVVRILITGCVHWLYFSAILTID